MIAFLPPEQLSVGDVTPWYTVIGAPAVHRESDGTPVVVVGVCHHGDGGRGHRCWSIEADPPALVLVYREEVAS